MNHKRGRSTTKSTMTGRFLFLVVIGLVLFSSLFFTPYLRPLFAQSSESEGAERLELPLIENPEAIIEREFYTLQYNEKFEQADWVAYELTREEVMGETKRKDSFKPDDLVETGSAELQDYKGSGYDRGHLAPAADMKMSKESMSDSFYMSNMSPQAPSFNRGIWAKLEGCVRTWADQNGAIYIVTGPILVKDEYPTIGENQVAVPEFYFKVILDYRQPELKAIGFILPNTKISQPLEDYAVTIDQAEEATGLDFFVALPDEVEAELEGTSDIELWEFKRYR